MRNVWRTTLAVAALIVSSASMAAAFEPKLVDPEIRVAEAMGLRLAREHEGFPVSDYAIFARPDTLSLVPGEGSVDAIIVGTPFERVSYASYVAALQDQTLSKSDLESAAAPYTLDVIVVAHSDGSNSADQNFLARFSNPILHLAKGTLNPTSTTAFGPALDFYNLATKGRVPRWLGYDSYRYDLRPLTRRGVDVARLRATLTFSDPYGRRYSELIDLSKFR